MANPTGFENEKIMKIPVYILLLLCMAQTIKAQDITGDSLVTGRVIVNKDPRLDLLMKKEAEFNAFGTKLAKGFRLLILKSNDREYSMKVRTMLLQNFPDQKVYMTFQAPFIKLKFGNFVDKVEAEKYRDMLMKAKFITNNIYVVPEIVEIKPDKTKEGETE